MTRILIITLYSICNCKNGKDALLVLLMKIANNYTEPESFEGHYTIYKNMALYDESKYTDNPNRAFIGKGSECGVVLKALLMGNPEIRVFDNFIATDPSGLYVTEIIRIIDENESPQNKNSTKLHFSFSPSNDRPK